jgi:Concanavalin A-like lectin/glucanases superfamily
MRTGAGLETQTTKIPSESKHMKRLRKATVTSVKSLTCAAGLALAGLPAAHAAYPDVILADHPSAYYRFEETLGSVAADSSVNGVNANYLFNSTSTSPALGQPGIDTNSLAFNGGGSDYGYVDIPYSGFIAPLAPDGTNSAAFSAELWVKATSQPATWTVPIELAQYPNGWNIYVSGADAGNGTTSYFYLDMRPPIFNAAVDFPIQFLAWYHLVLTFDGTNAMFYVNGVPHGPYNGSGFVPAIGSDAHIGSGQGVGWQPLNGGVDEVAFYTNVLSSAQVMNHYEVGTNSFRVVAIPPSIISDPASTTNFSGLPVTFTVSAGGTLPLHYQWLKNGVPFGSDSNPLTFICHYPSDDGATIQVIVTNSISSAPSALATLTVLTNLNIVGPPGSITRNVGSYAAFHVIANGAVPITYQWSGSPDGATFTPIPGATNATLWLSNVQMSQNGYTYAVAVTNPFTSDSASAILAVQPRTDPPVPLTGYGAIIAADKPVAYWRLNETDGTLAEDAVGSFDGAYTPGAGTVTYGVATGIPKSTDPAVSLADGAAIQVPFAPELNPDGAWSAETWINPSSLGANGGDYRIVLSSEYNQYPFPYNGWYIYQQPNNTFAFVPQPGNGFIVAGPNDPANNNLIVANKWYHLVVSDDTTNFNVYINGELRTGFPVSGIQFIPNGTGINPDGTPGISPGLGNTVLGQRTDAAFGTFQGAMDDTAFYNYALTPRQVYLHYVDATTITITRAGTNVVLTWPVGTLQAAAAVTGTYTNVVTATSPFTNSAAASETFWRVYVP